MTLPLSISRRMVRKAPEVYVDVIWTRDDTHRIKVSKATADDMLVAANGACYALELEDGAVLICPA